VQPSLHDYHDAIASRPQSKFAQLSETEFTAGLARLHAAADAELQPTAVQERYDVLAFTKA
jgi:hypothetical protein